MIVFPSGFNWPIWAAEENGFFAPEGLDVKLTPTPSSVFQLQGLIEGKFDVGMTAFRGRGRPLTRSGGWRRRPGNP